MPKEIRELIGEFEKLVLLIKEGKEVTEVLHIPKIMELD